jgi:hypothetical protein
VAAYLIATGRTYWSQVRTEQQKQGNDQERKQEQRGDEARPDEKLPQAQPDHQPAKTPPGVASH